MNQICILSIQIFYHSKLSAATNRIKLFVSLLLPIFFLLMKHWFEKTKKKEMKTGFNVNEGRQTIRVEMMISILML